MDANAVKQDLKDFLVSDLGVDESALNFDTPLFEGSDVGLDSIDSIEIISHIDEKYGVNMTGVDRNNFRSIDTITDYIIANKK